MNILDGAIRLVARTADATTAAAGAVGGAAINGLAGGLQGAAAGIRDGLGKGSHSPAAAAMTLGAIGAVGLVEWPVLLAVGGGALVVHQLGQRANGGGTPERPTLQSVTTPDSPPAANTAPARKTARSRRTPAT
jgi:hypothetical protein